MAGIWNINSTYNVNTKRMFSKLSFEVGQNFAARIMNLDKLTGEVLLKLLDGWQFSAKLQSGVDILPQGLMRFQVEGFEDGKLQLKILNTDNKKSNTEEDSIDFLLKSKSINVDKEDYPLLNKMIKHEMPLTKENISNMKTIVDFMGKIKQNPEEENAFIGKYMQSKNVLPDSPKGQEIKDTLKSFFNELKNLSEEDILIFAENNIDLTEDNIKSFNDMFKGKGNLYKEIKNIEQQVLKDNMQKQPDGNVKSEKIYINAEQEKQVVGDNAENIKYKEGNNYTNTIENQGGNVNSEKSISDNKNIANSNAKNEMKNLENSNAAVKIENKVKEQSKNEIKETITNKEIETGETIEKEIKNYVSKNNIIDKEKIVDNIAKAIKDQISEKTQEMKNIIQKVLEKNGDTKPETFSNIAQVLDKNMNDFKVFNTISNSYYYMDLPLNVDNSEYQCKLMIKDERKKGKKIDSTNVKIAASVNTNNMGVVDAYIKVNNYNMDINIKCDSPWIKILDNGKDRVFNGLMDIGYNLNIYVNERKQEVNIVNCREFFEDDNLGLIDKRV
ncbi:hypothetical protein Ccar_21885 [Clostridium carboxidivorans P7]|uniref:hypothetical protein n=1 Tax=Clostridium carboxidivorans TaxID=217159 RepID=UPI00064FD02F|nr:hypothetical protein [Clostridium carboxidivorans]AKN33331.1 hypothetical protein Ccar_21885 [Clostridium carboxidivorans P7]